MVYKKYIKRGGKTYGPYLYHSVKKDGKVTTNYLGRQEGSSENKNKGKNFLKSNKFLIMFLSIVAVALLLNLALDINLFPTGKVSSDIQGVYVEGQNLKGQVNLILKQGELFPADSQVIIDNAGKIEPYLLSSMIFNEKVTGNFYIEGKNLSGSGDGYGIPGQKEVFPNVLFSFRLVPSVSLDNVSEGNISGGVGGVGDVGEDGTSVKPIVNDTPSEPRVNESVSSNETTVEPEQPPANETPIEEPEQTQESPVTEPAEEIPPENPAEEQVPSEESSSVKESVSEPEPSAEEPASEPSSITGEVVGQEIIEGIVSKNSPYEYILPEGVDVEVVNSFQLVNFDIIDNKAIFTTDYSEFEEGFGQEFTGEDILTIPISLNNLSIKAKQGTLKISFNYLESELTSSSKEITVTAQNITNQTIMNVTNLTKQEKINKLLEKKIKFEKKALDELLVKDKIRVIIKTKPGAISVGEKLEGLEDYEFVELDEFNLELLDENEIDEIVIDQPVSALISESESIIRSLDVRNEFGLSGLGKKICIIDTGVDGSVTPYTLGWDFVNNDSDASDDNGHGTQVAYIAKSVAPGAELLVAKVLDSNGLGYESQVLEGLQWCVDNGANIISFSIGSGDYNGFCDVNVVAGLANIAVDNGIFVAAATGNDGTSNLKSPACASSVTRVSASDKQDAIASFSNVNEALDVFAPGKDISTQTIGGSVTSISGTSASVLFVSGAAALVLENETIAPLDLRYRFASTGKPILHSLGENLTINISRLDVYNAIINNVTMVPYNVTLNQANETNVTNFTGLATTYTLGPNLGVYDTTGGGCLLLGQLNVNEIGTFFQSTFSYSACFGTGSCIGGGTFDWCSGIICKSGFFSDSNCYENFDLAFASGYFSSSTDVVNAVVGSNGVYDVYICGRASSGLQNPSANPCCYGVATSYACNENIGGTVGCWDGQANCDSDSTCHIGVGSCRANSATLNVYTCDNTDLDAYQTQCVTPCGNIWTGNGGQNNCCGDDLSEPANPQATETSCWDGTDNDCDGFTDSADTNCQCTTGSAPGCSGGVCVNGICRASCEGYSGYACSAGAGLLSSGTCADDFGCLTTPFVNMDCSATGTTACEKGTDYSYYTCDYYSNDSCDSSIGGDFVQNGISALVGVDCGCGTSCVYDAGSFLANCSFNPTNGPQCDDGNQGSFLNHGDFNAGTQRYDSNDTICDECNNGFLGEDSTCEKVCGASASCDEKLPNADTGACTYGVSQREDFCSSICGASDGTCESACGASTQCDEKNPGYDLTYCG
ncbi:MAG TPA: S8 family serine peptidase, partial [Candidatus Nanoarchaeia archaeon]|nr:S8 family serine peptidase [Candidatus Nanoarchaeia archaeon]